MTDMYQLTMAYSYWKSNRHESPAVFEAFFRKGPFHGEFAIFAGLEEVLNYLNTFSFSPSDITYIRTLFPETVDDAFFDFLAELDLKNVRVRAVKEGSIVFPRTPLVVVEGPLLACQLLETAILNLTNFATLIATNAKRMRIAAGASKTLLEFGLRRAQGPDGALSASKYVSIGGFDGTSNCLAGKMFDLSVKGTIAHSFICSFDVADLSEDIFNLNGKPFWSSISKYKEELGFASASESELVAFATYAHALPSNFLALVDTYDTLQSGVPNFLCVALALIDCGYTPLGIRLDSGDLAYLSIESRKLFNHVAARTGKYLKHLKIAASNDINEAVLLSLNTEGHDIDTFGIGTNLVTCQQQPALGMVYKLVELNNTPRIKLSNDASKITLPGRKALYRLKSHDGEALCDLILSPSDPPPVCHQKFLCQHPFELQKRCFITPTEVESLLDLVFSDGIIAHPTHSLLAIRERVDATFRTIRSDVKRLLNPAPYKVSVSFEKYEETNKLWMKQVPMMEFS